MPPAACGVQPARLATSRGEATQLGTAGLTLMNGPELTSREISLIYFQRFQATIFLCLRITTDDANDQIPKMAARLMHLPRMFLRTT